MLFSLCFDLLFDMIIVIRGDGVVECVWVFSFVVISRGGTGFWFGLFCDYDQFLIV